MPDSHHLLARPLAVLTILLALAGVSFGQDADDEFPYRPGLIGEYRTKSGATCRRTEETLKFVWPTATPDPRLPNGEFSAIWQGRLFSIEPGEYQLHVYAAGDVELVLKDQTLLKAKSKKPQWHAAKAIRLTYGHHPLEIRYQSAGDASEIGLFWQGPRFQLEPVPAWHLFHDPDPSVTDEFAAGQRLAWALRCNACHEATGGSEPLPAPSLVNLRGNLRRSWLVEWLTASHAKPAMLTRRMPDFSLNREQAESIADYLFSESKQPAEASPPTPSGDAAQGKQLFLTMGCLACHQVGTLGRPSLFGGGDLTAIATKRPADFFAHWLADPAAINTAHRMPVFKLSDAERGDLSAYLSTLGKTQANESAAQDRVRTGKELVIGHRCGACHVLPEPVKTAKVARPLNDKSNWEKSCLLLPSTDKQRPGYGLSDQDATAVRAYFQQNRRAADSRDGAFVLQERNCIACHARGPEGGIATLLPAVIQQVPDLAPELPLLTAPSLLSVGDKLHDATLAAAITTRDGPRRPWLAIRMPKFNLAEDEMQALIKYFVHQDRIPDGAPTQAIDKLPAKKELTINGARLVTADGFGCTSCHKIGEWTPKKVALNARGTELSVLGDRLRKPWFDRWVRNPARIVPRMEMPSIKVPARKMLDENLDHQLAAVWQALNQPDFTPPAPSAIRLVGTTNRREAAEPAQVLTDVLETEKHVFIRPLLVALPNRHNVLIDQETNTLAGWWIGDTAWQRTRGKSWYWEPAAASFWPITKPRGTDITLRIGERTLEPEPQGQHISAFDAIEHVPGGIRVASRLRLGHILLHITQTLTARWPETPGAPSGFDRRLEIVGVPPGAILQLDTRGGNEFPIHCRVDADEQLNLTSQAADQPLVCNLHYTSTLPVNQTITLAQEPPPSAAPQDVVPGYTGIRLPLPEAEMPTALAWREDGTLIVASLKGRVCLARDADGDGLEDQIVPFSDELAAPYGIAAHDDAIDVITKYALLRLYDADSDGRAERTHVLASGWGHTADYHDWAVGLPRDAQGNYYIALPCQQDDRSTASAHLRGRGLKLSPRTPTRDNPDPYSIDAFCEGLRFPMGLAISRSGQLFASDNQGNYNPFNELNHLLPGRHYGFINKLELKKGDPPPLTPPAIDIPHPWTRSVNGICFLDTPETVRRRLGRDLFGPHEGHLIGCEYDTRRLVRMSLEQSGDTWQGAIYPFTAPTDEKLALQGPVCCAVSPQGDLYVGSMRDSGWGGGANVGSIARLRPSSELPPGIAEAKAIPTGFRLEFTQPIDGRLGSDPASYSVSSYRRISTPAYGGPDVDRKSHEVRKATLSSDRRSVLITLDQLREGFVYELRLANLAAAGDVFHPAEAYYTLRKIPVP